MKEAAKLQDEPHITEESILLLHGGLLLRGLGRRPGLRAQQPLLAVLRRAEDQQLLAGQRAAREEH